jgi:hypothetical protein
VSYVVIVTPTEGVSDIEVVGAFTNEEDAMEWVGLAFSKPRYKDHLFRVKKMQSRETPADTTSHG